MEQYILYSLIRNLFSRNLETYLQGKECNAIQGNAMQWEAWTIQLDA